MPIWAVGAATGAEEVPAPDGALTVAEASAMIDSKVIKKPHDASARTRVATKKMIE
jgi:hypothetical protein